MVTFLTVAMTEKPQFAHANEDFEVERNAENAKVLCYHSPFCSFLGGVFKAC